MKLYTNVFIFYYLLDIRLFSIYLLIYYTYNSFTNV